jgi:hypothetical protein
MAIKSPKLDIGVYLNGMTAPWPTKRQSQFFRIGTQGCVQCGYPQHER